MVNYMRRKFFYLVLSFFILGLILIMATKVRSSNFINNKLLEDDDKYMASYIDGEYQNEIPGKNDGYIVDKIVCDNGAVATWDNEEWGINIRNAIKKIKCSLYFRLKNDVTVTYDNNYVVNNIFEKKYDSNALKVSASCTDNTYITQNVSYTNGYKSYNFIATAAECSRDGLFFNNTTALDENVIYYYSFEARANEKFNVCIGPEQNGQKLFSITLDWQKYSTVFTSKNLSWKAAFTFYYWMPNTGTRTLEVKNITLQEGEYDNYSTISLKEADKLNDTLPTPTRENYTFLGWYTDPIEGDKISGDTVVTNKYYLLCPLAI